MGGLGMAAAGIRWSLELPAPVRQGGVRPEPGRRVCRLVPVGVTGNALVPISTVVNRVYEVLRNPFRNSKTVRRAFV